MIVHMLSVAGKSRHCDHFFPLFYGADDHTGSTMGNDHPAFPQLPGEAFSVQKPAVFIMLWLIIADSDLGKHLLSYHAFLDQQIYLL